MDSLSTFLQPYKSNIGIVAVCLGTVLNFSGLSICDNILKKRNTDQISSLPFVISFTMGLLRLRAGLLLKEQVVIDISAAAIIFNLIYCTFYFYYSNDKWNEILKQLFWALVLVSVMWAYVEWEDPTFVKFRYGFILTTITLSLLRTPFGGAREVMRKKDASNIPFLLTLVATLASFSMVLFSIILKMNLLILQNTATFFVTSLRLSLTFKYPEKPEKEKKL